MRTFKTIALSAATAAVIAGSGAGSASAAAPSAAAVQYEGTVVSVDRSTRTFRLRDSERGTIRIKVRRSTRFERISGFGALQSGMRNIEATVRRSNGRWVALSVERSGGGGNHGGDDNGGDDNGGRGRGGDDD